MICFAWWWLIVAPIGLSVFFGVLYTLWCLSWGGGYIDRR